MRNAKANRNDSCLFCAHLNSLEGIHESHYSDRLRQYRNSSARGTVSLSCVCGVPVKVTDCVCFPIASVPEPSGIFAGSPWACADRDPNVRPTAKNAIAETTLL